MSRKAKGFHTLEAALVLATFTPLILAVWSLLHVLQTRSFLQHRVGQIFQKVEVETKRTQLPGIESILDDIESLLVDVQSVEQVELIVRVDSWSLAGTESQLLSSRTIACRLSKCDGSANAAQILSEHLQTISMNLQNRSARNVVDIQTGGRVVAPRIVQVLGSAITINFSKELVPLSPVSEIDVVESVLINK